MSKHDHQVCNHENLKFCKTCQIPYCKDCGKEWGYQQQNWWYYPSTITTSNLQQNPNTLSLQPYYKSENLNVANDVPTVTCKHEV